MDLVDLIQEKRFLGQEFLAWLWYKSEERGGSVEVPGKGDILVVFEKHMLLEYGEGEASEKVICRGLQTELKEARAGLALGKKPEQARIMLAHDEREYHVTLTAALFEFRNVKLPKTVAAADEGDDPESVEGRILERIALLEELTNLVMDLFRMFLARRATEDWPVELAAMRRWITGGETAGHHEAGVV
jgi:recombination associated protein RdgC